MESWGQQKVIRYEYSKYGAFAFIESFGIFKSGIHNGMTFDYLSSKLLFGSFCNNRRRLFIYYYIGIYFISIFGYIIPVIIAYWRGAVGHDDHEGNRVDQPTLESPKSAIESSRKFRREPKSRARDADFGLARAFESGTKILVSISSPPCKTQKKIGNGRIPIFIWQN